MDETNTAEVQRNRLEFSFKLTPTVKTGQKLYLAF